MYKTAVIAIVGKPNVGKSSLFNRLIGKKQAIISEKAGTTRDRLYHKFDCNGYETFLVDTGGLQYGQKENIEKDVQSQALLAIEDSDLILFLVDIANPPTKEDFSAATILRKTKKPVIFIGNKCDNSKTEENKYEHYELGFGEPMEISAIHKKGIEKLVLEMEKQLKKLDFEKGKTIQDENTTNVCILGRPNAGKSSLVNAILGSEKIIVSDIPGTTRDTIDTEILYKDKKYNLIDTAGIRKRGKIEKGIEKFSSMRCLSAIEKSDVVVLIIDGKDRISKQDCHIASYALEAEKGFIIVINKIDILDKEKEEEAKNIIIYRLQRQFAFAPWAPVVFVSAKNKTNIYKILDLSDEIMTERNKRIPTAELNSFFQKISNKHMPASSKFKKPKFLYASQVDVNPPSFVFFFKNAENLHFSYPRYLENEIRKEYGFTGTSLKLKFRNKVD